MIKKKERKSYKTIKEGVGMMKYNITTKTIPKIYHDIKPNNINFGFGEAALLQSYLFHMKYIYFFILHYSFIYLFLFIHIFNHPFCSFI